MIYEHRIAAAAGFEQLGDYRRAYLEYSKALDVLLFNVWADWDHPEVKALQTHRARCLRLAQEA